MSGIVAGRIRAEVVCRVGPAVACGAGRRRLTACREAHGGMEVRP